MKKNITRIGFCLVTMTTLLFTSCEKNIKEKSSSQSDSNQLPQSALTIYVDIDSDNSIFDQQNNVMWDVAEQESVMQTYLRQSNTKKYNEILNGLISTYDDEYCYCKADVIYLTKSNAYTGTAYAYSNYSGDPSYLFLEGSIPYVKERYDQSSWLGYDPYAYSKVQFVVCDMYKYTYSYDGAVIRLSNGESYLLDGNHLYDSQYKENEYYALFNK